MSGRRPSWRRPSGDDGSVMLLILGFTVVLLGLVAVVADVSVVLMNQRAVASAADGAAVAAAQQLDESTFYREGLAGGRIPLDKTAVAQAVARYEADARPPTSLSASVDGPFTVVVRGSRSVQLPFSRFVGGGSVTVRAVARATSPLAP